MLNRNVLMSQLTLKDVSVKKLAKIQGWSLATAYRKVNSRAAWTLPEAQRLKSSLNLDPQIMNEIFFNEKLS